MHRRAFLTGATAALASVQFPVLSSDRITLAQGGSSTGRRYFAETGHNLNDPLLSRWKAAGGEKVLGAPISEERYEEGFGVVQSLRTVTLMYDPGLEEPWDVQGQPLPRSYIESITPPEALKRVDTCVTDGCSYIAETGHGVSAPVGDFWEIAGGKPIIGLPVSELFRDPETGRRMQVFERAVIVEAPDGTYRLRNAALELLEQAGRLEEPAFLPSPPTGGETWMVKTQGLNLRSAPDADAEIRTTLLENTEFIAVSGATGEWKPGYADGLSGWVAAEYLTQPPPLPEIDPKDWDPTVWQGVTLGETNVRAEPTTKSKIVKVLDERTPVTVTKWVKGEEVFTGADIWAEIGPGRYAYARNVGRNAPVIPPPPPPAPTTWKWIDVNLTQQLMTAYEDTTAIKTVAMTSGSPGWETPTGTFQVLARVANETMTNDTIGAENFYKLEDVLYCQYFTDEGHAIHYAWWRTAETIGRPGSHGCLNVLLDDARFFWNWAEIGALLVIHN